ncbi:ras-related protein Rab-20-like [Lytechinus variegatus]|uniref:ras-related protein Rab-20-like n=1 Tax=Lytechinus variegatus TaxID=7654 RepID=UPI001BB1FB98|nr:ras-related protein Rab-20-like [Lytechinus variegatus]
MAAAVEKKKADVKIVIVGDATVGKTTFIRRYMDGVFTDNPGQTVGACFFLKQWGNCNIALWDTAGEERFSGLSSFYCRNASAAIIAYDITRRSSFELLQERYIPLLESAKEDCLLCLTGMKNDLVNSNTRQVAHGEAKEFACRLNASRFQEIRRNNPNQKIQAPFFETSSKTGANVDQVFEYIFSSILPRTGGNMAQKKDTVDMSGDSGNSKEQLKKKGCCN